jgi:DNA gyrase subunit A
MVAIRPGLSVLTVCEKGYGKRTDVEEYRLTRRGGKGVINIKTSERNGKVVAIRAVGDDDELMIITAAGIMLRTDLSQIREIGRATQGVRIIRPDSGDRVVAVAKIANEEDNDQTGPEGAPAEADAAAEDDAQDTSTQTETASDQGDGEQAVDQAEPRSERYDGGQGE